jgi:hypothetical protein
MQATCGRGGWRRGENVRRGFAENKRKRKEVRRNEQVCATCVAKEYDRQKKKQPVARVNKHEG